MKTAEQVKDFEADVMLYCEEHGIPFSDVEINTVENELLVMMKPTISEEHQSAIEKMVQEFAGGGEDE